MMYVHEITDKYFRAQYSVGNICRRIILAWMRKGSLQYKLEKCFSSYSAD